MTKSTETSLRVRYGETDKMGYVYYGNYAEYYEVGRIEWLRSRGISYRDMEIEGIMAPVISFNSRYIKPARFDDEIRIKTTVDSKPGYKMTFSYTIFNQSNEVLSTAETTLVFINMKSQKIIRCSSEFLQKCGFQ